MRRTATVAFPVSLNSLLHWHGIRVQSLVGVYRAYGGCRVLGGCEHSRLKISFPCQRISCCRFNAVIRREEERRGETGMKRRGETQGRRGERKGERRGKEIKEKERRGKKRKSEERKGKTVKER